MGGGEDVARRPISDDVVAAPSRAIGSLHQGSTPDVMPRPDVARTSQEPSMRSHLRDGRPAR